MKLTVCTELSIMDVNPCLPCDKPRSAATW